MDRKAVSELYREMRDTFLPFKHWSVSIITAFPEFERVYGKRADKRRKLSNGGMTCQLYQYFREKSE